MKWRRLDQPAHEAVAMQGTPDAGFVLHGTVRGQTPDRGLYSLAYRVHCASDWVTRDALVEGTLGDRKLRIALERDTTTGLWTRDGLPALQVATCVDVDLGFSPSTNTLPIRRLRLDIGAEAAVRAAWLRFPELTLEPLEQIYRRIGRELYVYESAGGDFRAELVVDASGLVRRYGDLWIAE